MKRTVLLVLTCLMLVLPTRPALAQRSLSATENSYRQARRILDGGIQALGGRSALASAQNFSLKMSGRSYEIFSSQAPDPPFDKSSFERSVYVDTSHHRIVAEEKLSSTTCPYIWWTRDIVSGADEYFINLQRKTVAHIANPEWTEYRNWLQLIPHSILAEALERAATLRLVGHAVFQGRKQAVISFATAGGQAISLYFDARTKLLTKHEYLYTRNTIGDTSRAYVFTGYRDVGGMKVPGGRIGYNAGYLSSEAAYTEIKFNQQPGESLFDLPPGLTTLQVVEPETTANKLADDVYLLQSIPGGYNVLFVAFNDYVLVAEAPESDVRSGLSELAIARIKETLPGKPIKYLVLTHHHGDHASGARAFMAEGAHIITTPGNKHFLERLAAAPFLMSPDALARRPRPPVIDLIAHKQRIVRDNKHIVELYDIGPTDHAREMVIVYLPKEKLLFQSDLFNPITLDGSSPVALDSIYHGIAASDTRNLLKSIEQLGLKVERIAGAHGRVGTWQELTAAVRNEPAGTQ